MESLEYSIISRQWITITVTCQAHAEVLHSHHHRQRTCWNHVQSEEAQVQGLAVGAPVRCIRAPYFGRIGTVSELPIALQQMESETMVRVLTVEFEDQGSACIPRANVEVIER